MGRSRKALCDRVGRLPDMGNLNEGPSGSRGSRSISFHMISEEQFAASVESVLRALGFRIEMSVSAEGSHAWIFVAERPGQQGIVQAHVTCWADNGVVSIFNLPDLKSGRAERFSDPGDLPEIINRD